MEERRPSPTRTIDDATVVHLLGGLRERDQKGRQKPEVPYGTDCAGIRGYLRNRERKVDI